MNAVERVALAREQQRAWAQKPFPYRCEVLRRMRRHIAAYREQIVQAICAETGKVPLDALAGDVLVVLDHLLYCEKRAGRVLRSKRIGMMSHLFSRTNHRELYEPFGVVVIYAPANYPFQLAVVPMSTALVAGNAVILKCSERTARVAALIESCCAASGVPLGLVQVVCDAPESASAYVDAMPDLVFFTGGAENGREVARRAAERLIPTIMELGGKDAAIVFADCAMDRTIAGVTYGAFSNAGQVCVGIKRLYVQQEIYSGFLRRLIESVTTLRIGSSDDCDLGILRGDASRARLLAQVQEAIQVGAVLHTPQRGDLCDAPIILSGVPAGARLMTEETFGPVLVVVPFHTEDEAIRLANDCDFALSASVWTTNPTRGQRVASALQSGSCAINDVIRNIGDPRVAFGGNRRSGYGRYHGAEGLRSFTRTKSVMIVRSRRRREINWFPFTSRTFAALSTYLGVRHGGLRIRQAVRRLLPMILFCAMFPISGFARDQASGHLWIRVTLPERSHGDVAFLVFASSRGFPNQRQDAVRHGFAHVAEREHTIMIDAGSLPPGDYAVAVYQDVDGNGKLNSGMFGIPTEPVGASNNPKSRFGPPRFKDCRFHLGDTDETISIALVKP